MGEPDYWVMTKPNRSPWKAWYRQVMQDAVADGWTATPYYGALADLLK